MKRKTTFLKISYLTGAVLDGFTVVPMVFPKIGAKLFGLANFNPDPYYRYAMFLAASLMLGWTILLLWAYFKPFERRGVLIITVIPVICGIIASNVYAVVSKAVELRAMLPVFIAPTLAGILFLFSCFYANSRESSD